MAQFVVDMPADYDGGKSGIVAVDYNKLIVALRAFSAGDLPDIDANMFKIDVLAAKNTPQNIYTWPRTSTWVCASCERIPKRSHTGIPEGRCIRLSPAAAKELDNEIERIIDITHKDSDDDLSGTRIDFLTILGAMCGQENRMRLVNYPECGSESYRNLSA